MGVRGLERCPSQTHGTVQPTAPFNLSASKKIKKICSALRIINAPAQCTPCKDADLCGKHKRTKTYVVTENGGKKKNPVKCGLHLSYLSPSSPSPGGVSCFWGIIGATVRTLWSQRSGGLYTHTYTHTHLEHKQLFFCTMGTTDDSVLLVFSNINVSLFFILFGIILQRSHQMLFCLLKFFCLFFLTLIQLK